jgi:hypothetical protein
VAARYHLQYQAHGQFPCVQPRTLPAEYSRSRITDDSDVDLIQIPCYCTLALLNTGRTIEGAVPGVWLMSYHTFIGMTRIPPT